MVHVTDCNVTQLHKIASGLKLKGRSKMNAMQLRRAINDRRPAVHDSVLKSHGCRKNPTLAQLRRRATVLKLKGRSKMNKEQLKRAIKAQKAKK
jgi:hypothetical protein